MRFAVQGIENFMKGRPDMGEVAQKAAALRGKSSMLNTALEGQAAVSGIQGHVAAKTGELLGDAQAAAGRDKMWGSIFQTAGQVGGAAINKFGGNLGGGFGSPGNFETGNNFTEGYNIPRYSTNYGF